jgi:hypothetical protein
MRWLRCAWCSLLVKFLEYQEAKMGFNYAVLPEDSAPVTVSTWTIRYTTADRTWRQGRYADLGMAQMNARLAAHAEMMAEVEPY